MLKETNLGNASDLDGAYIISNIPIGRYTLLAMFIGYESLEKEIWIEKNQEYIINIILQPSIIEIQETKVTAEKRKGKVTEAPASMEIISSRDIKREATTNMGSYLKGLKGVDFTSSGINNYSISIRGFNSSFNTRVLTLTDGRVANLPALRVINYSAIPQSMDDIERMEVVLGPATALYGANAHSGVVNIISKSPAQSEGLTMGVSGSNDARQLRKINGRWAKKVSKNISIKLSGTYLHAYEWPYISEQEYKSHLYPWSGHPYRMYDGKDNNPWNDAFCGTLTNGLNTCIADSAINIYGKTVAIGDGEPNHDDIDGDGVAGEDWWNGYDDDGDCLALGQAGDSNGDGCICCSGDIGVDEDYFTADGIDNNGDGKIDENIDGPIDQWADGYDNDGNIYIDTFSELYTNDAGSNFNPNWSHNIENNNMIVVDGRRFATMHGKPNPWYIPNTGTNENDLQGDYYYDEKQIKYMFDVYIYDFGLDGIPGDPFEDQSGDDIFQPGEPLTQIGPFWNWNDFGLDGIDNTDDIGEGDGIWDPGDCWVDNGNNVIDQVTVNGSLDQYLSNCDAENNNDLYPLPNGKWDEGEIINDWGNDGLEGTNDPGENDGILVLPDTGEGDGIFDKGDGIYGFEGEPFVDRNEDGIWNTGETFTDINGDNLYTPPDYEDNFQSVHDINGDGLSDYPDFEVENGKLEFRLDFDPSYNYNMTFQTGYATTKTQQVTGTSRYLADGFEYKYYQLRARYNNWYTQVYMNESFSGNTRNYNNGTIIEDRSKNYAFQIQRNDEFKSIDTKLIWGMDYFKTLPFTNGTILNDGPNGYDNDGDYQSVNLTDQIDNDNDGEIDELCPDGMVEPFLDGLPDETNIKNGRKWSCGENIDELDEFDNPESNEYGLYFQTKTELFGTSRFQLITAARFDTHDLLDEGLQFAPKIGFIYKPNDRSSFRFTYGKAFNTPNAITLYTDLYVRKQGTLDIFLKGNKDGTPYCRVGETCSGSGNIMNGNPGYYKTNPINRDSTFISLSPFEEDYFTGNIEEGELPYSDRVNGVPYFLNKYDTKAPTSEMIPLDTSRYLIYIPELNGTGTIYTPEESFNIPNVAPIKTEKIQTIELGYKGFLGNRTHLTIDYYLSYYEDFFSPPTFITPAVILKDDPNANIIGFLPINNFNANPPFTTAWNGQDDDSDWEQWADEFGWGNTPDAGEWGYVWYPDSQDSSNYTIFHPEEVLESVWEEGVNSISWKHNGLDPSRFVSVGVDEFVAGSSGGGSLNELDLIPFGESADGETVYGQGIATSPPHLILSPMNYGNVWMQGVDISLTQLIPEYNLIIDGNISWYGTTDFYNELTKNNDPINAPEWKWNSSIKWDSPIGELALNYRHVNRFEWNDGIWSGIIGPYDIFDIHYNYVITNNLEFSFSALNIMDDRHKELIGGATMGKQIIMRMTSNF